MRIEVLGPGCARCNQLYDNVLKAVSDIDSTGIIDTVKIQDVQEIVNAGVFMTPGLVIDSCVVSTGKVLSPEEIRQEIQKKIK
ncbi:MAG: thioredoxin family protein [Desulfobacteraceae bacterium]|nr:thioredoxin family protein [Desulfobacteraceae bacterium]